MTYGPTEAAAVHPVVEQVGDQLTITWPEDYIIIGLSRWKTRDAATLAECSVTTTAPGIRPHLHTAVLNLTSGRSQADFINTCQSSYRGPDWSYVIKTTCLLALERRRLGEPVIDLATAVAEPLTWRVEGWIPDSGTTLTYGDGGSAKSLLAMYLAGCIQLGKPFLGVPTRQGTVLFIDFEDDIGEQKRRMQRIARGAEWLSVPHVLYHLAQVPIAEAGPEIRFLCDTHQVDFVIVDSLGYAGAASNDPEPVMAAHRVLRSLGRPVLAIHHVAKNEKGDRTPFGSVYHRNSARSCIEVRRVQEPGEDSICVGLYHTKLNAGRPQPPTGARVMFTSDAVIVQPLDPKSIVGLAEGVPLTLRVLDLLKRGAMAPAEIVEELDVDKDKLGGLLRMMKRRGRLAKLDDGRYGLAAPREA